MNRPLIAVIFILVAIGIAVTSLFYIKDTHKTMTAILDTTLEIAKNNNKEETKKHIHNTLKEWEERDDLLNVLIGQAETNDVKSALTMAVYFAELGDTEQAILYINECKVELERIKNTNELSLSTIF